MRSIRVSGIVGLAVASLLAGCQQAANNAAANTVANNAAPTNSAATSSVVNLVSANGQWVGGRPPKGMACGQATEHFKHPLCGYPRANKPPDSACVDLAKAYSSPMAPTVAASQTCAAPQTCKSNHVLVRTPPKIVFEDIPPGSCPGGVTAGWSCDIDVTYDSVCG